LEITLVAVLFGLLFGDGVDRHGQLECDFFSSPYEYILHPW